MNTVYEKQQLLKLKTAPCLCGRNTTKGGKPVYSVPVKLMELYRCRFCRHAWLETVAYLPYDKPKA